MPEIEKPVRFINPPTLSVPTGYTHVVEVGAGRTIHISGQVALDLTGKIVGVGDLRAQTVQVFENLKAALAAAGAGFENVIKCHFYLLDISQMGIVREVRNQYFNPQQPPASTAVEVRRLVDPDWLIEIEAIAYLPEA